jgi:DNA polymerase-3 subunit beta
MEFFIQRDVFLEGIQRTLGIVDRKTTIQILNNVLIKAENERVRITATDREISLIADYNAHVITPGETTVGARKLFEMIREIEGDRINFKRLENDWVYITCEKIVYRIPGIPADDFPEVADERDIDFFIIERGVLKEMISKTFFAISTDEMRANLNGVYLELKEDYVGMVSTDGHRISIVNIKCENEISEGKRIEGIIIPRKGIGEIRKLVENGKEHAEIGVKDGKFVVKLDDVVLRVGLIEDTYPDYRRVVPKDKGIEIRVDKRQLLHALRRMDVMSSERYSGVRIEIADHKMILNSTNPDVGEANDEIDISYEGAGLEIGYNVKYLIDAIEVIDQNLVSFEMRSDEGAGVIRSVGMDNYMCVIMPIKLRRD